MPSIHRRNVNFYLALYATCEMLSSAYSAPGGIEKIDMILMSDVLLSKCYKRVWALYEKTAEKLKGVDGERDYAAAAKGPNLLKAIQSELKRRFNKKKNKKK
jgi:hypothetical protein